MKKLLFLSLIVSNILLAQVTDGNGKSAVDSNGDNLTGNIGIGTTTPSSVLDISTINYASNQEGGINLSAFHNNINRWTAQVGLKSNSGGSPRFAITTKNRDASNVETANIEALSIHLSSGNIGVGTTTPAAKLDVEGGNFYLGAEVSSNGQRREFRVYGYDNSNKFYGSLHSNYDDSKRSFDISTNDQTSQIKIDASANSSANIILKPGVSGYVGIGTSSPDAKLAVKGDIHTQEVKVDLLGAVMPDYVFYKDYKLKTLTEVEQYINEKGHLPNIPSAKDVETNGLLLKEMNLKLLEKIEELTLYTIEQEKEIEASKNEITILKNKATKLDGLQDELQNQKIINKNLEDKLKTQGLRLQKIETLLTYKH